MSVVFKLIIIVAITVIAICSSSGRLSSEESKSLICKKDLFHGAALVVGRVEHSHRRPPSPGSRSSPTHSVEQSLKAEQVSHLIIVASM